MITGGCLCGKTRYEISAAPLGARMCWCRDCQRIASGSATVNVLFPWPTISFAGEPKRFDHRADSGNVVERGFCPECGAQLYSRTKDTALPARVRAGTLDNPELAAPTAIIWASSAPSWVMLDPALTRYPHGPPAPQSSR